MAKRRARRKEELELDLPFLSLDYRRRNFDSFAREESSRETTQVG
jgi:hypothetical protein